MSPRDGGEAAAVQPDAPGAVTELAVVKERPEPDEALVVARRSRLLSVAAVEGPLPAGMASEEQVDPFRELRSRLVHLGMREVGEYFTTLVVPVAEGSGASFVARNLAAAFTLQERVALLVDCNFRNPSQHATLGPGPCEKGLFDVLRDDVPVPLEQLIMPTAIRGLHLIAAGECDAASAWSQREYFSSRAMHELMVELRREPCCVVLDGPPVLGAPDARMLSDLADFVVLVVGYGRSTAEEVAKAVATFDRAKIGAVVFNERPSERRSGRRRALRP